MTRHCFHGYALAATLLLFSALARQCEAADLKPRLLFSYEVAASRLKEYYDDQQMEIVIREDTRPRAGRGLFSDSVRFFASRGNYTVMTALGKKDFARVVSPAASFIATREPGAKQFQLNAWGLRYDDSLRYVRSRICLPFAAYCVHGTPIIDYLKRSDVEIDTVDVAGNGRYTTIRCKQRQLRRGLQVEDQAIFVLESGRWWNLMRFAYGAPDDWLQGEIDYDYESGDVPPTIAAFREWRQKDGECVARWSTEAQKIARGSSESSVFTPAYFGIRHVGTETRSGRTRISASLVAGTLLLCMSLTFTLACVIRRKRRPGTAKRTA